jgi:hypothetical protein
MARYATESQARYCQANSYEKEKFELCRLRKEIISKLF